MRSWRNRSAPIGPFKGPLLWIILHVLRKFWSKNWVLEGPRAFGTRQETQKNTGNNIRRSPDGPRKKKHCASPLSIALSRSVVPLWVYPGVASCVNISKNNQKINFFGDRPGTFVCCSPYFSESPGVFQTLWDPPKPTFSIFCCKLTRK